MSLSQHNLWPPESGSTAFRGFATAASIHACDHLRRHLRLGLRIRSSLQVQASLSLSLSLSYTSLRKLSTLEHKGLNFLHLGCFVISSFAILLYKGFNFQSFVLDSLSLSAAFDRNCSKSLMLHERSSQEELFYSTGLTFSTPEMISDLRCYPCVSLMEEERVG